MVMFSSVWVVIKIVKFGVIVIRVSEVSIINVSFFRR